MGLKGNNFQHAVLVKQHISPQDIKNAAIAGTWIDEPWQIGNQVAFIILGGAIAAGGVGALTVEGKKRSDGSAVQLTDVNGSPLAVPAARVADAGAVEGAALLGTINLDDVDSDTYSAIRLKWAETADKNYLAAVAAIIYDLYAKPSGQTDELFALTHVLT